MAFSDDFTGTSGQLLSARAGWTLMTTEDCLKVNASNQLGKPATSTGASHFYATGVDSQTTQAVTVDLLSTTSNAVVLGTGSGDGSNFAGYVARKSGTTALRVYRIIAGALDGSPLINIATVADYLAVTLQATVNASGNVDLVLLSHGTQIGSTTDSSANKRTSGRRGLWVPSTGIGTSLFDNYSDNYSNVTFTIGERSSRFFAIPSLGANGAVSLPVTLTAAMTNLQARLVDGGGTALTGFDWTTKAAAPAAGAYSPGFASVPPGGPYFMQTRDSAATGTVVSNVNGFYVGAVIIHHGQSQVQKLGLIGYSSLAATTGMTNAFAMKMPIPSGPGNPVTLTQLTGTPASTGSGVVAIANQFYADTGGALPLLLVDISYQGTSITDWTGDASTTIGFTWGLWTGFAAAMLAACDRQATAIVMMHGTTDVGNPAGFVSGRTTLKNMFLTALPGWSPLFLIVPHQRSNDNDNLMQPMRQAQYAQATSGDPWRVCCHLDDWQMDADGSPHQLATATGNIRGGTRIGRGIAKHVFNAALDIDGPQVVTADFTDATRTAVKVVFDRDLETPSGATTGLPGHFLSTNNGSSFAASPTATLAAITATREITVAAGATLPVGTTRYDLLRNTPFSSISGDGAAYVGTEAAMEAAALAKVLCDTTAFDGGRGMPARPLLGTGVPVALPIAIVATNATGSATLRVRQGA